MILDQLQQKFPDMPNLRVRDITVDKILKKVSCTVSYPNSTDVSPETVSQIRATVVSAVPMGYKCEFRFANDKFNERSFLAVLLDIIKKKYPLFGNIKGDKIAVKIFGLEISATFSVSENTKMNMEISGFLGELEKFFRNYTCYKVIFAVNVDKNAVLQKASIAEQEKLVQLAINRELLKPKRFFNVSNVQKYIGKEILTKPMYISDIRAPMDNCVVCGVISEKQLRGVKKDDALKLCKFNLTDGSQATFPCTMFVRFQTEDFETLKKLHSDKPDSEILTLSKRRHAANDNKLKKVGFLGDGLEVLVRGKVVYSNFSERLELNVFDICKCKIEPINLQPTFVQQTPDEYVLVKPQSLEEYRQLSFDRLEEGATALSGKEYVVLCANTTGYSVTKDKIFNICAVRVADGHLSEKWSTLLSPEVTLTDEQLKEANTTVRQLASSPTITEIIADLYKFVGNATLVGTNLPQLLEILNYYGAPLGFNFKNKTEMQSTVLSALFDAASFDTRPNCSQLDEVVKFLKLNCRTGSSAEVAAIALGKCMTEIARNG